MAQKNVKLAAKQAAEQVGELVNKDVGTEFQNLTMHTFKEGVTVKSLAGVSDAKEEAVYGRAYLLYNTGRYKESSEIFRVLITIDSTQPKYMIGLAACFHMMKEYDSAIGIYNIAGFLDPTNPVPFFHLYDCFIQLDDTISAKYALKSAIDKSRGREEFKTLFERCEITLKGLEANEKKTESTKDS